MKRTVLWSTSRIIGTFNKGKLSAKKHGPTKTKTVVRYRNRNGRMAYKGSKTLKGTQKHVSNG